MLGVVTMTITREAGLAEIIVVASEAVQEVEFCAFCFHQSAYIQFHGLEKCQDDEVRTLDATVASARVRLNILRLGKDW